MDEVINKITTITTELETKALAEVDDAVVKAKSNVSKFADASRKAMKSKFRKWNVRSRVTSFRKKVDMKLKKASEKVVTILNEEFDEEEFEEIKTVTETATQEFETFVDTVATELENESLYTEIVEPEVVAEFKQIIKQTKEEGKNKTEGLKVAINIGKLKDKAKKDVKKIQDEITERMLKITTVETTEETEFETIQADLETRAEEITNKLIVDIKVETDKTKTLEKPEQKLMIDPVNIPVKFEI